jgi:DNA-binding CsgD family transcriptional regulator
MRLLERDDELELLVRMVVDAADGAGSLVLVGGEAGIGKTTLVRALRDSLDERVAFFVGACEPLSVPIPLGPVRELVEAAGAGELAQLGSDDRLVLMRAFQDALERRAPVVAVIEDLHWADPLTLDLVRLLSRRVEQMRAAIIATFRDDEAAANPSLGLLLGDLAGAPGVRRISMRTLSEDAVRELAAPSDLDAAELARVTGGNPFLVVESVSAGHRLPASVRDAALARVGRLGPAAQAVVRAAAVMGQRFDLGLLDAVAPDSADAIEQALDRGVLVAEGGVLGFRHELIREALEASISPPRRAELHARVLAAMAGRPGQVDNARLAHHAELAGLEEEGCRYAIRAAADAAALGAQREVARQTGRALALGRHLAPSERLELLVQNAYATNFSSLRLQDARESAEQAIALAIEIDDGVWQGRALIALAYALWSLDLVGEAKAAADQAVAVLQRTDDFSTLARAHATQLRMEATAFDPEVVIAQGPSALELASRAGLEETRVDVAISMGLARAHLGDLESLRLLQEGCRQAREGGFAIQTVRSYVNQVYAGVLLRQHAFVDATAREALCVFEEYQTTIPGYAVELYVARSLLDRGRWSEAARTAMRQDRDYVSEAPVALAMEGLVRARRGEVGAYELLARAWKDIQAVPESSRHGMIQVALIEAAWLCGDRAAALSHLRAAAQSEQSRRFGRTGGELALWASRYGVEFEAPPGAPEPVALELAGKWRAAIAAWRELEAPYEAALAALPGDDRAARAALGTLRKLGATATAKAFARERVARGARPIRGPRHFTLANAAGLTRREQEVLEQLATGASNAAIAAAFHLSERTVGHHVSAILGKLGAPNRLAAVEQARARGLLAQDRQSSPPN